MTNSTLSVLILNGTLKLSPEPSSTEVIGRQLLQRFSAHDVHGDIVRPVDFVIAPGVEACWQATARHPAG